MSNSVKTTEIHRSSLYFSKFLCKVTFTVPGSDLMPRKCTSITKYKRHIDFISRLHKSKEEVEKINKIDWVRIKEFFVWLTDIKSEKRITFPFIGNKIVIYTSDLSILNNLTFADDINVTKVIADIPEKTLWLNDPKYKYRLYFKSQILDHEIKSKFATFLLDNKQHIHPSATTKKWVNDDKYFGTWSLRNCKSSYFIEFDDHKFLMIMRMKFDQLCGKLYSVETKPKD